jgi:hypothetical protein
MEKDFEALVVASSMPFTVKPRSLLASLHAIQNIWLAR